MPKFTKTFSGTRGSSSRADTGTQDDATVPTTSVTAEPPVSAGTSVESLPPHETAYALSRTDYTTLRRRIITLINQLHSIKYVPNEQNSRLLHY
jgi:hypothetical protein